MTETKLRYRPEIDGLRAVAVLGVILYHANFSVFGISVLGGGFVGVDIFFVISGFLITKIILTELDDGKFNILSFYNRRIRRIIPMLLFVIIASAPFAYLILQPSSLIEFAKSAISSISFVSNYFFYFSTTEYGSESAQLKPLLHTWSLSIEEQFYLIFPAAIILIRKFFPAYLLASIALCAVVSFHYAFELQKINSALSFFNAPSRIWELLVGALLAFWDIKKPSDSNGLYNKIFSLFGMYLVLYGLLFFNTDTPHPSVNTLVPVLGVVLVIRYSGKNEVVGHLLSRKPIVWIGLISYSAYLWHFVVFSFVRNYKVPTSLDMLLLIGLTFCLSAVSYQLIERPVRRRQSFSNLKAYVGLVGAAIAIMIFSVITIQWKGFPDRLSKVAVFENFQPDNKVLRQEMANIIQARRQVNPQFYDVPHKVLIVGNSHAVDLFVALLLNKQEGFDFLRGNLAEVSCANESIQEYDEQRKIFYGDSSYREATAILVSSRYALRRCNKRDERQPITDDLLGLVYLINRAKSDGKQVVVLGNKPEFSMIENNWVADHVFESYLKQNEQGLFLPFTEVKSKADELLFNQITEAIGINERVREVAESNGAQYFDKTKLVCSFEAKSCDAFTNEGFKTLLDYGHWTREGAALFGQRLVESDFLSLFKDR